MFWPRGVQEGGISLNCPNQLSRNVLLHEMLQRGFALSPPPPKCGKQDLNLHGLAATRPST